MPLTRATRHVAAAVAAVGALGAAFTAGVVAGAGSAPPPPASVLDEAAVRIEGSALRPVDRPALDAAAIEGMLRAAGDPWGQWQPTDGEDLRASIAGVGLWLRAGPSAPVVARVTEGSPAQSAGVQVGDEVHQVDGRPTAGAAASVVAPWLRGAPGTRVDVVLARGSELRTVALRRTGLPPAVVTARTLAQPTGPVTVLAVPSFERGTGRQVREAVQRAAEAGLVLDLRGNAGGLLDEAVEVASAFLDGGPVVRATRRDGTAQSYDALGTGDADVPLAVLVDGGSASAAEVVAGVLQERGRAVLVGSRTYGKGSVQEPRTLSDGSSLQLTVAAYTTPSGRSIEGVGLAPDIEVAPGAAPGVAVQRAADVLPGLRADGRGSAG